jgi:hypothetical protein
MLDDPKRPPQRLTGAARRQRAYRQRVRAGIMKVDFEIDSAGLDWLVRVHALDTRALELVDMRALRRAVGEAVTAMIKVSSRA